MILFANHEINLAEQLSLYLFSAPIFAQVLVSNYGALLKKMWFSQVSSKLGDFGDQKLMDTHWRHAMKQINVLSLLQSKTQRRRKKRNLKLFSILCGILFENIFHKFKSSAVDRVPLKTWTKYTRRLGSKMYVDCWCITKSLCALRFNFVTSLLKTEEKIQKYVFRESAQMRLYSYLKWAVEVWSWAWR